MVTSHLYKITLNNTKWHEQTEEIWVNQYQLPGRHGDDGVAELGDDVGRRVSLQQGAQRGSGVGKELCYICSRASTRTLKKSLNQGKTRVHSSAIRCALTDQIRHQTLTHIAINNNFFSVSLINAQWLSILTFYKCNSAICHQKKKNQRSKNVIFALNIKKQYFRTCLYYVQ